MFCNNIFFDSFWLLIKELAKNQEDIFPLYDSYKTSLNTNINTTNVYTELISPFIEELIHGIDSPVIPLKLSTELYMAFLDCNIENSATLSEEIIANVDLYDETATKLKNVINHFIRC